MVRIGLDIGGTKTQMWVADSSGAVVLDETRPSAGWSAKPASGAAAWIAEFVADALRDAGFEDASIDGVGIGAQGCEVTADCEALQRELVALTGWNCRVRNDAELIVPAAGLLSGIGVIAGTGAIAVARSPEGELLRASGWGWVLSDDGSASALVRDAARAVLERWDRGLPLDALGAGLLASVGVPDVAELAWAMSWHGGPDTWGTHCPAVFAAATAGSDDARRVIEAGARSVAAMAAVLAARGADASSVVVAGGTATKADGYWALIRAALAEALPGAEVRLLDVPPVAGALALA